MTSQYHTPQYYIPDNVTPLTIHGICLYWFTAMSVAVLPHNYMPMLSKVEKSKRPAIACHRALLRITRRPSRSASRPLGSMSTDSSRYPMATPIIVGIGAIAAAVAGRSLMRRGLLGGKNAAEQWVKGGFKAKMDRREAIAILGIK